MQPSDPPPARQSHEARLRVARRFLGLLGHADVEAALEQLSETATYEVVGEHGLAGTFRGREEAGRHLTQLAELTKETFQTVKWDDWLVGEAHVAAVAEVQMEGRGQRFAARMLFLLGFTADDTIRSVTVFSTDPAAARRFFWG